LEQSAAHRTEHTLDSALSQNGSGANGNGTSAAEGAAAVERLYDGFAEIQARDIIFRRLLGVADGFAILISLFLGAAVVGGARLTPWALLAVPLFVVVAKVLGLYDRDEHLLHKTTLDEMPRLFGLATGTALLLWLSGTAVATASLGRVSVLVIWAALFVSLAVLRSLARMLARRAAPVERCLFVGDPRHADEFREKLASSPAVRAELVGWIPARGSDTDGGGDPLLPELIRSMIAEREIHRVVLGSVPGGSGELLDSIRRVKDHGLKVSVLPDASRVVSSSVELDRLNGITLLGVRRFEITRSSRVIKRSFDLAASTLALVALSPVLAAVAIAIKLESPGPVLFRQRRAGRHGEPFWMLKFRSMVDGAEARRDELLEQNEAEGVFKIANDPRITRVGRVIRKLHVDELAQLVNVVQGEMSLVGPRPLPLEEDRRIVGWHRRRLDIRPGITGPWQVLGSSRIPVREMVNLDYQYVADWSVWNDIRILLLTASHVAHRRGL
jgi:exopolysaccharide biosynthesis polyprenyl glycosylphosphotransferase